MATTAVITLERLHCIHESDGTGHSEPYIWPVLIWIDTRNGNVGISDLVLGNARVVIKNDMRAGETVNIPSSVSTLRVQFADDPTKYNLILSVALWESDETPEEAMRAGFKAYSSELRQAIIDNLLALLNARGNPDEEKAVKKTIEDRVKSKVESGIKGALTTWQKAKVKLGSLNLDDIVGGATQDLGSLGQSATRPISLAFSNDSASEVYEIQGNITTRPVPVDLCQSKVDAVTAAQDELSGIRASIQSLQDELHHAGPQQKPGIIKAIKEEQKKLPAAIAALDQAKQALKTCRDFWANRPILHIPVEGVITQA
ncbi:hypothetical protein [Spirosoma aerophilum]